MPVQPGFAEMLDLPYPKVKKIIESGTPAHEIWDSSAYLLGVSPLQLHTLPAFRHAATLPRPCSAGQQAA
jgi:hypothetical protein